MGYHVFETTESELRLSGGQSNGCLGSVDERPIIVAGAKTPRGKEEKMPGVYDRGEGAPVSDDCFIRPDVPVLLPLPEPKKRITFEYE